MLDGKQLHVNLELVVDAATDAAVGISVRDEEDSAAVVEAFEHGAQTTGAPPLALLLDNRPSNHTADVDAAIGDALRIRATPERPPNKAHVEGSFGLFAQKAPPLELDTRDRPTLAKTIARLVATTFFRALNRAPRAIATARPALICLLGIVRNVHHVHESEPITEALIRERLAARDRFLAPLVLERDAILVGGGTDVGATLAALVDRLVCAEYTVDRHIWLHAAADLVAPLARDQRIALANSAARRIHAAFRLSTHDRARIERALLRRLWPLA